MSQSSISSPTESLSNRLAEKLKVTFGYDSFRPGQQEIVEHVARGNDALVLMPTGGGKSLCYQLPALVREGLTVVISPLIALMKDQVVALQANGVEARFLNSTLDGYESAAVMQLAEAGTLRLLYVAPERLALPDFRAWLMGQTVGLIAIDEAHCISEWGHDFRPDYRSLRQLRTDFPDTPLVALTATATQRVREDIAKQLGLESAHWFTRGFDRPNLTYRVKPKGTVVTQVRELLSVTSGGAAVVYCFSRKDCEKVAAALVQAGTRALAYHAGLEPAVRQAHQEAFMRDEVEVMVATIAFGMGIDKPDIRLVVHADLPKTLEGYYQETGRAGRDGLPAECVLLFSAGDRQKQEFFIQQIEDEAEQQAARHKLAEVMNYGRLVSCRRGYILGYFGEKDVSASCQGCDNCLDPRERFDGTLFARKILSGVARTGERFGTAYVAAVLVGKTDKKLQDRGHHTLSVFGIMKDHDENTIKELIEQLVSQGLLAKDHGTYPTLALTAAATPVLKGQQEVWLVMPAPTKPAKGRNARKAQIPDAIAPAAAGLFERLRALRRQLASEQGIPPYMIFGDSALIAMTNDQPTSLEAFQLVPGVGEAKLQKYGDQFTRVIREFSADATL